MGLCYVKGEFNKICKIEGKKKGKNALRPQRVKVKIENMFTSAFTQ